MQVLSGGLRTQFPPSLRSKKLIQPLCLADQRHPLLKLPSPPHPKQIHTPAYHSLEPARDLGKSNESSGSPRTPHTHTHIHTFTCTHANRHTYAQTHTSQTFSHRGSTKTHTQIYPQTYTLIRHTCTHTHTHVFLPSDKVSRALLSRF